MQSPFLRRVVLRGVPAVCNTTAYILSVSCPELVSVDLSLCRCLNSASIADLADGGHSTLPKPSGIKELRVAGLRNVDKAFMLRLATGFPSLQILDISRCQSLTDDHLLAFVTHDPVVHFSRQYTTLTDKQAGFDASSLYLNGVGCHLRRITSLRHINLSACPRLTDRGLWHIAHAVPKLEYLELAGMNTRLHDDGLLALLPTVPRLAKLDLEEATEITNDVLEALTPSAREESDIQEVVKDEEETGSRLNHLIISFAGRLTSEAIQRLIEGCPRLRILEADVSIIPVPLFILPLTFLLTLSPEHQDRQRSRQGLSSPSYCPQAPRGRDLRHRLVNPFRPFFPLLTYSIPLFFPHFILSAVSSPEPTSKSSTPSPPFVLAEAIVAGRSFPSTTPTLLSSTTTIIRDRVGMSATMRGWCSKVFGDGAWWMRLGGKRRQRRRGEGRCHC